MNDKLLERMKKLLAMSQDSTSEHEAMIAAKRLHALLSKHGMSMSDLGDDGEHVEEDAFETVNFPYRRQVAFHVAKLYYCDMYYITRYRKNYTRIVLVGKEHHRKIAKVIIDQVLRIIDRDAQKACLEDLGVRNSNYISSFRNGAARTISLRCLKLIEEAKAGNLVDEDTGENLPALASLYDQEKALVDEFMSNKKLREPKSHLRATSERAMLKGSEAGKRVPLHQGLSKTAPKLLD